MTQPSPTKQTMHLVLVVEDDFRLAELLSEVLTFENCLADVAANGMEARGKLQIGSYDAVICDLVMPLIDGEALYHEVVREYPFLADKFLFITGHASARSGLANFIYQTRNALLEKPFEMEAFRAALRELFAR